MSQSDAPHTLFLVCADPVRAVMFADAAVMRQQQVIGPLGSIAAVRTALQQFTPDAALVDSAGLDDRSAVADLLGQHGVPFAVVDVQPAADRDSPTSLARERRRRQRFDPPIQLGDFARELIVVDAPENPMIRAQIERLLARD